MLRRLVSSSKNRRDEDVYVAEGTHLTQACILSGGSISLCVLAKSALVNDEVSELTGQLEGKNIETVVLADSLFESVSSIHAAVGILVLFTPTIPSADNVTPLKTSAVLLDNVQNPGNVGTILRTAAAAGVTQVFLSSGCASPWSSKSLRAGMGAQFSLDIYEDLDIATVIEQAVSPVFAATLTGDSKSLYDLDLTESVAWLFGSEGQGVSDNLADLADARVYIPQAKTAVESLNVSAAAAVCLYEQYRQTNSSL